MEKQNAGFWNRENKRAESLAPGRAVFGDPYFVLRDVLPAGRRHMTRIEGLRTGNYKVLKDMTMGRLWHCRDKRPLTPLTAVLGKNGVGKSVLLEACSFLKDCVQSGVVDACDRRGGFSRIRSLGQEGPIELEIQCREDGESRAVTYELAIDCDAQGRPYVARERFGQEGEGQQHGKPVPLLILNGEKVVPGRRHRRAARQKQTLWNSTMDAGLA